MTERHNPFRVSMVVENLAPVDQKLREVVMGVNGYVWNQRPYAYEYGITMAWYRIKESGGNIDHKYVTNLQYMLNLSLELSKFDFSNISWNAYRAKPQLLDKGSKKSMEEMLKKMQDVYFLSGPERTKNIKELTGFLTSCTETLADTGVLIPDYNNFDLLSSVPA